MHGQNVPSLTRLKFNIDGSGTCTGNNKNNNNGKIFKTTDKAASKKVTEILDLRSAPAKSVVLTANNSRRPKSRNNLKRTKEEY